MDGCGGIRGMCDLVDGVDGVGGVVDVGWRGQGERGWKSREGETGRRDRIANRLKRREGESGDR